MKSKKNKNAGELTRREFLKSSLGLTASAALVWPQTVPSSMLAASAPSNRITIGCIGVGRMGLGPAPWAEYTEKRVHPQDGYGRPGWLRISDYCCGMITGWGSHHIDIAQWAMGTEYTGPVEVEDWAEYPKEGLWDIHGKFRIEYTYADGVKLICEDNTKNKQGILFEGTEGWVYVRRRLIDAQPTSLLTSVIRPNEIHLARSNNHKQNFLECIKSRSQTVAPVEIGHRSNTVCVLGYIAMLLGRKLKWNPGKERFINDTEANRLLSRPMRSPWKL